MKLLNDNTTPRVRSSDGVTVSPCGCAYSDREWLQMCDADWSEFDALGRAARAARDAGMHGDTDWMEG